MSKVVNGYVFGAKNDLGDWILVKFGEEGYYAPDWLNEEVVNEINEAWNNSPAEIEAAVCCSMFNNWDKFEEIAKSLG